MRLLKIAMSLMVITIFTTVTIAQTDLFVRKAIIPAPAIEDGGFGEFISGVDFDNDGKTEIYAVNDNWGDTENEIVPRIYKYEFDGTDWQIVWMATPNITYQNTWPPLQMGDWDQDGNMEIIWGPINASGNVDPHPSRILVYEAAAGQDDVMGIPDGDNFLPNAQWTILPAEGDFAELRPFASAFTDVDNDGWDEFVFTDRRDNMYLGRNFCR